MEWNFGSIILTMFAFFFWFLFIWMFIAVFGDIFRRDDLTGWAKAGWVFLIVILPFLGILIYLIARPKMTEQDKRLLAEQQEIQRRVTGYSASDEIAKAAKLQQDGAITAEEFEKLKSDALARQSAAG
jgi:Phospholipase_D-nuclease N-terminal